MSATPRTASRIPRRRAGIKATAAYAGVCEKTVRNWIASGRITGCRVGPKLLQCDLDELNRIIRPVAAAGEWAVPGQRTGPQDTTPEARPNDSDLAAEAAIRLTAAGDAGG